ncbi:hypothetical protein [Sphingomonas sp. KC8]|uniref:hypothetical protein n=1 Tax=Sphingomonas sp. KC8 TaxID=1030157 RepID=UPI00068286E2|nr:hypothetical protein [Sphingomonas sp. KC8]ARS29069.1 hypothetical protein KC8_17505 [Sphingomonas sp. KC8]
MADEDFGTDLFGAPAHRRHEWRGRPEHAWSLENSNKVLLMFAQRRSVKEAATAIGVSVPTLRKHYFSEVAKREAAVIMMEATQLARLNSAAVAGNVAAEKELFKRLEKERQRVVAQSLASPAPKPERLGKKESAARKAEQVSGLYETPPAPGMMN